MVGLHMAWFGDNRWARPRLIGAWVPHDTSLTRTSASKSSGPLWGPLLSPKSIKRSLAPAWFCDLCRACVVLLTSNRRSGIE